MRRIAVLLLLVSVHSAAPPQNATAPDDPVLRAMTDELQRSMTELRLNDLDKPYFIQYTIQDQDTYTAGATFGSLTVLDRSRGRVLHVQVRVGDYTFDSSEFVPAQSFTGAPPTGVRTTSIIDNDYYGVRHALWLATDAAYKQAVEQFARKRAFVQNKTREDEGPDFSKEEATTAVAPRRTMTVDSSRWEKQIREWSAVFRQFPDVQQSAVSIRASLAHRYLVNSEGTRTLQPSMLVTLDAGASVQAPDGLRFGHSIPVHRKSLDELPSGEAFTADLRQLAADLTALRNAPLLDKDYAGPAIVSGPAAAELFARVLAPNLSGQKPPLMERDTGAGRSELLDRLNRRVLPSFMSVVADPTQAAFGTQSLLGHYVVDDQGVPARRVPVVEDGVLTNFLMSRRPGKELMRSNGHGRLAGGGRETVQIGNLFVTTRNGLPGDQLKQKLIELCRAERLDYGVLIRAVDGDGRGPLGSPVLAYKVFVADGREELVRASSISGINVRSFRTIEATGDDAFLLHRLSGPSGAPTATSIVAPSVLLDEIELKRPTGTQQKPALLTHPFFRK